MTGILWNLISFIVALGILVAVHEFGHFWVARRCGVKVEKFSIGFGKSIWSKVGKDGTEYSISMIPLGGYVKMVDSRVDEVPEHEKHLAFDKKPLWKRTSIVAAGPIFNFLFAIFAYWLVFLIGIPAVKPVIGEVTPNSIVAEAGIESGMELKSISGIKTPDWESVNMGLISHIGDDLMTVTLTSANEVGSEVTKTLDLREWKFDPETQSAMQSLGFAPYTPEVYRVIEQVSQGGAAEKAGVLPGDEVVAIGQQRVTEWKQVVEAVRSNPDTPLELTVLRQGYEQTLTLTPGSRELANKEVVGFAGIAPKVAEWPESYRFDLQFGVFESIGKAVDKTGQVIGLTISMLKKLIVGDVGLNNLSGPISIAKGAGATADYGLVYFLGFLALISVNLGIINLVPLPMLDGGHLLFFAIEAVIRRPVPEKVQEMGFRIGGAIIFSLMALALFNDFTRL
ncbi:sigma E protease regulator RseP [Vibrio alginolyticus]|jgi:regulator of sigma E protease|uniref:Zinc metalloprotease n=4 Tax=Vibrio harveyi group TaxID=717610 RepID=A0A0L8CTT2_VIBAL|nr:MULTISPECIES: sigma E protease regulator RseP [Vibrio]EEZ83418.1 Putative zinc metalloprotease [Vibrio alginolyticus 40B]MDW1808970.1 sigma E protease regulator RseP [Vibrio sp. Vb2362]MDW1971940.1 sigma E protease regulator RseP [Vibrio sp. 945]MDW2257673.1 sigma E protease regulator RseP [Vibrio sp. 1409]MDW2294800.1 sigma E protease regulator RseP [Vibrio sp. 1404]QCO86851.1 sigma E protease regulator RseP [Vibrio neocaledonicus]